MQNNQELKIYIHFNQFEVWFNSRNSLPAKSSHTTVVGVALSFRVPAIKHPVCLRLCGVCLCDQTRQKLSPLRLAIAGSNKTHTHIVFSAMPPFKRANVQISRHQLQLKWNESKRESHTNKSRIAAVNFTRMLILLKCDTAAPTKYSIDDIFFCLFIILAKLLSILIKRRRALIARNCVVRCPAAAVQIKRAIPHP